MSQTYSKQFTNVLQSQPGATSLESTNSEVNGRGAFSQLLESLSVSEHTALVNRKGEMTMNYTIGEHIEYKYGFYMTVGIEKCAVCWTSFPGIFTEDPGSHEAAIGVSYVCNHPVCREIAGGSMLMSGTDMDMFLAQDREQLDQHMMATETIDGCVVDVTAIIKRRDDVEFENDADVVQDFYIDNREWFDESDHVDLETEKWNNYWGDYNQCGIHVGY